MHLVGFIIRIYHDSRSPERQIRLSYCISEVQNSLKGLKLSWTHQFMVCAEVDVRVWSDNKQIFVGKCVSFIRCFLLGGGGWSRGKW